MKKKGIFIVIALLLVAAVLAVVFVFLFKDKNTKSLATDLNTAVTKEYLSKDSNEYKTVQEYLERFKGMAGIGTEMEAEVTNYWQAYEAYTTIATFFNNEAPFMEHTKTYSKNRKKVVSALNSAHKNAKKMVKTIEENRKLTGGNETWERVVWNNYKEYVKDMISDTMRAFEHMATIYKASVSSKLLNNDLTDVLFMGINQLNKEFRKNAKKLPNLGGAILRFAQTSFNPSNVEKAVLNYYYTPEANHAKMKDIKEKGTQSLHWPDVLNGNILR